MIHTFILELIAAISLPEYDAFQPNLIAFLVVGYALAILPGCFYVLVTEEYCARDCISKCVCKPLLKCYDCTDCTRVKKDFIDLINKLWDKFFKPGFCAVFGPFLYYYGNNITKVVDLSGASNTTQGNITDNNALVLSDEWLRASAVAALFAFILISNIDWQPNSESMYLWGPVADMLVKLVPLDVLYSALLQVARINMISTPTMFCRVVDQAFFGVIFGIAILYTIYSIYHSCTKYKDKCCSCCKWLLGVAIGLIFVVYLLADKLLPLNFLLCWVSVDDDVEMAAVMNTLNLVRAILSGTCAISVLSLFFVPECLYIYRTCTCIGKRRITQAQLATQLENDLNTLLNTKDNEMAQSIVHSVAISVAKLKAADQSSPLKYSDFKTAMSNHSIEVAKLVGGLYAAQGLDAQQQWNDALLDDAQLQTLKTVAQSLFDDAHDKLNTARQRLNYAAQQLIDDALNDDALNDDALNDDAQQLKNATQQLIGAATQQLNGTALQLNVAATQQLNVAAQQLNDTEQQLNVETQQLNDAVQQLNNAAQQLNDVAQQLNDVAQQLNNAAQQLNDAAQQLNDAAQQLNDAEQQLNDAAQQLNVETQQLNDAEQQLNDVAQQLNDVAQQLNNAAQQLNDAEQQLNNAAQQLNDAAAQQLNDAEQQLNDAAQKLNDVETLQLNDVAQQLNDAAQQLNTALVQHLQLTNEQKSAFESMNTLIKKMVDLTVI